MSSLHSTARILKAQPVVDLIYDQLRKRAATFTQRVGRPPTLATVLVGTDEASRIYVSRKSKACGQVGVAHKDHVLSAEEGPRVLRDLLVTLNRDDEVDGILVQSPLPSSWFVAGTEWDHSQKVFERIDPSKDVDCFTSANLGIFFQGQGLMKSILQPCTPQGILQLLRFYGVELAGRNALVLGRSLIVGRPIAELLLQQGATVTVAHSGTRDLAEHVSRADLIVSAVGKPGLLHGGYSYRPHVVVVDVGMNRLPQGKVVGDLDAEAVAPYVAAYTPVPGGVGPMTIAALMMNTILAAESRSNF